MSKTMDVCDLPDPVTHHIVRLHEAHISDITQVWTVTELSQLKKGLITLILNKH